MAKVGAAASVKKTTKTANAPVQAAPVQQPVPQAVPTGMAMTPQNVTAYTAPTQYAPTPEELRTSKTSSNALRQMGWDKRQDMINRTWDLELPTTYTLGKRQAWLGPAAREARKEYVGNQRRQYMRDNPNGGEYDWWPTTSYAGRRAIGSPNLDQNYYDLWLLANGIRF